MNSTARHTLNEKKPARSGLWLVSDQRDQLFVFRRAKNPNTPKPASIKAYVSGSGMAATWPLTETASNAQLQHPVAPTLLVSVKRSVLDDPVATNVKVGPANQ